METELPIDRKPTTEELAAAIALFIGSGPVVREKKVKSKAWCCKCRKPFKSFNDLDRHHITYRPKKLVWLCPRCHRRITYLNREFARKWKRKLNSAMRKKIWVMFMSEKISDNVYNKSAEAIKDWF